MMRTSSLSLAALATAGALVFGCSSPSSTGSTSSASNTPVNGKCAGGTSQTTIVSKLAFARQKEGVTAGFDVDGFVSDGNQAPDQETNSCSQMDFEDADGTQGIDNQLARLMPLLDTITAADVNLIIKGAIENGQLLTAITLSGIDNFENDPCVEVLFQPGLGSPTLGTDGELDPSQTFEVDKTGPTTQAVGAIKNGYLEIGPFDLNLLVVVFAEKFNLHIQRARVRAKLDPLEGGRIVGSIGGGVKIQDLVDIIAEFDLNSGEREAGANFIKGLGDLDYDPATKSCKTMSVGVTMSGRRAFIVPAAEKPDAGLDAGPADAGASDAEANPDAPKSADETKWETIVKPIAERTCGNCHSVSAPGRIDLRKYSTWVANKSTIRQRVLVQQDMPPSTISFSAQDRSAIASWVGN